MGHKTILWSLLACLLLPPASQAQRLTATEMREKAAEEEMQRQELVNLQGETVRAIQMNNTAFFRRVFSDDYLGTFPSGRLMDKNAFLNALQTSPLRYSVFLATDIRVRIFETTAVVTCLWTARGSSDGREFARQSRVTTVYVYGQRGWQAVASQETQLPG